MLDLRHDDDNAGCLDKVFGSVIVIYDCFSWGIMYVYCTDFKRSCLSIVLAGESELYNVWSTAIRSDWQAFAGPWPFVQTSAGSGIFTLLFCLRHSRFISMFVSKNYDLVISRV